MAKRLLVAQFHRNNQPILAKRYFNRVDTAIPRCVQLVLLDGEPGDTIQISSSEFGYWIADIRVRAGGKIDIKWGLA